MATTKNISAEFLEQLAAIGRKLRLELPELIQRGQRLDEAASENSLSGHLRRAIHRSGHPLKKIAAEVGVDVFVLCDFLEGTGHSDRMCWTESTSGRRRNDPAGAHTSPTRIARAEKGT